MQLPLTLGISAQLPQNSIDPNTSRSYGSLEGLSPLLEKNLAVGTGTVSGNDVKENAFRLFENLLKDSLNEPAKEALKKSALTESAPLLVQPDRPVMADGSGSAEESLETAAPALSPKVESNSKIQSKMALLREEPLKITDFQPSRTDEKEWEGSSLQSYPEPSMVAGSAQLKQNSFLNNKETNVAKTRFAAEAVRPQVGSPRLDKEVIPSPVETQHVASDRPLQRQVLGENAKNPVVEKLTQFTSQEAGPIGHSSVVDPIDSGNEARLASLMQALEASVDWEAPETASPNMMNSGEPNQSGGVRFKAVASLPLSSEEFVQRQEARVAGRPMSLAKENILVQDANSERAKLMGNVSEFKTRGAAQNKISDDGSVQRGKSYWEEALVQRDNQGSEDVAVQKDRQAWEAVPEQKSKSSWEAVPVQKSRPSVVGQSLQNDHKLDQRDLKWLETERVSSAIPGSPLSVVANGQAQGVETVKSSVPVTLANLSNPPNLAAPAVTAAWNRADETVSRWTVAALAQPISALASRGGGTVRVRLEPEQLGPVQISVTRENGKLDIRFEASTAEAKNQLQANVSELREALASRNQPVQQIQVEVHAPNFQSVSGTSEWMSPDKKQLLFTSHDLSQQNWLQDRSQSNDQNANRGWSRYLAEQEARDGGAWGQGGRQYTRDEARRRYTEAYA